MPSVARAATVVAIIAVAMAVSVVKVVTVAVTTTALHARNKQNYIIVSYLSASPAYQQAMRFLVLFFAFW